MIIAISYSEPRFLLVSTEKRDKLQQLTCLPLRKFPMASSVARICLNVLLWLISSRASLRSISGSATSWSKYEKEGKKCKENGKRGHRRWRGGKRMEEKGKECLQQIHTTPFPLNGKTNFLPRAHVPLGPCTRFSPVLTMGSGYEIL